MSYFLSYKHFTSISIFKGSGLTNYALVEVVEVVEAALVVDCTVVVEVLVVFTVESLISPSRQLCSSV